MIELEIQLATEEKTLPHPSQFREWISAAYTNIIENGEMTIRIVDVDEMSQLNKQYRKKNGPTNVLSFPGDPEDEDMGFPIIGDIVICAPIVGKEAKEQRKELIAHWAHIVIHGSLHLLGYDHYEDEEAEEMEGLETEIMVSLGYPPPYGERIPNG